LPIGGRTQQAYYACVRQISEYYTKSPDRLSAEDLRQYFIHLKEHKKVARQTSTQALCAIKMFWEKTLQRTWPAELELARANPEFKLPVILSANEVRRILGFVKGLDHRVCLTTIYSCGLRLGEGLRLQVGDIDSQRMFLHIRGGKGNKDRCVPLPQRTLELLRQQWKSHCHATLLFAAKGRGGIGAATAKEPVSRTALQGAFRLALKAGRITKHAHNSAPAVDDGAERTGNKSSS
jgi:integrase/recombinase XerD